jgi:F0F1-type ATP synthase assembly protein I
VLTTVAEGWRLVRRALIWQVVAVAVLALAFLPKGIAWSFAVLAGGGAIAIGGALSGALALGGGVGPATGALMRMVLGLAVKWVVVVVALVLAVGVARLPALAALVGVVVALVVQMLAMAGVTRNGKH